jgi:hypothetical protein
MSTVMRYLSTSGGRYKVTVLLERITLTVGAVMSVVLYVAIMLR